MISKTSNILLFSTALLSACTGFDTGNTPVSLPRSNAQEVVSATAQARPAEAVTVMSVPAPRIVEIGAVKEDKLPSRTVGPISAQGSKLVELTDLLAADLGIGMIMNKQVGTREVGYIDPRQVDLQLFLDRISKSADVYWRYKDGVIEFSAERNYMIRTPRVAGLEDEISTTLTTLGGTNVHVDNATGGIYFAASPAKYQEIKAFVGDFASRREMIVYDAWFFEVVNSDREAVGIDWSAVASKVDGSLTAEAGMAGSVGGFASSLKLDAANFSLNLILDQIRKQGRVSTLAQPTITLMSGRDAEFSVGGSVNYVSGVSSVAADGTVSKGVETSQIQTGVDLTISGDFSDGVITTDLNLSISDVLGFDEFETPDGTVSLPRTSDRAFTNTVMGRPGDAFVFAGFISERKQSEKTGMAKSRATNKEVSDSVQSELVMIIRPRVIRFANN